MSIYIYMYISPPPPSVGLQRRLLVSLAMRAAAHTPRPKPMDRRLRSCNATVRALRCRRASPTRLRTLRCVCFLLIRVRTRRTSLLPRLRQSLCLSVAAGVARPPLSVPLQCVISARRGACVRACVHLVVCMRACTRRGAER